MNLLIGERLRRLRIGKGLTQQQLGEKLYVIRSTVAKWESGDRIPDAVMIGLLSDLFDTDIAELMSAGSFLRSIPAPTCSTSPPTASIPSTPCFLWYYGICIVLSMANMAGLQMRGLSPDLGPLHLSVLTRETDGGSEIVVEDTGPGFVPSEDGAPHIALANIRQGDMGCGGTRVTVFLPAVIRPVPASACRRGRRAGPSAHRRASAG